jgi:hypothetical protein
MGLDQPSSNARHGRGEGRLLRCSNLEVAKPGKGVSDMCEHHPFRFDEDKAYEDQLVSVLEASPEHPLSAPEVPPLARCIYSLSE